MNDFLCNIGVRTYNSKSRCNKRKDNLNYLNIKYICIGNKKKNHDKATRQLGEGGTFETWNTIKGRILLI